MKTADEVESHPWARPDDSVTIERVARDLYEANRLLAYALVRCELAMERDAVLRGRVAAG
jgi:hypothetical protein